MSTIDERIVELGFENQDFERGVDTTLKTLERLKEALKFDKATTSLDSLAESNKNISQSLDGVSKDVDVISNRFSTLGIIGTRALQRITDAAIDTGKKLVKSLTVDNLAAGWDKYELKTKSVRTILESTKDQGETLESVSAVLDDLAKYTDLTSYDFAEMVKNIGKFTAVGVPLERAEKAMEGIANAAALSGVEATGANHAMYNLAQALGTGSVKLIDWKSINIAGMATKEFKNQIIDTAIELGVLRKVGEHIGKTAKGTTVDFKTFEGTLREAWFNSDVLIEVLNKYADTTTEIGKASFEAAKEALTFKQAMIAIKDAISTGWMNTFEYIFGNVDQASDFFTNLCDSIIATISPLYEFRNEMLKTWGTLEYGGRSDFVQGLSDALEGLLGILYSVGKGFAEAFFPDSMLGKLSDFSIWVKETGASIKSLTGGIYALNPGKEDEKNDPINQFLENKYDLGQKGEEIKELQRELIKAGYEDDLGKSGVDGIFGKGTEAALAKYRKMREPGALRPWEKIIDAISLDDNKKGEGKDPFSGILINGEDPTKYKIGQKSDNIRKLQQILINAGYEEEVGAANGVFGKGTRKAFEEYWTVGKKDIAYFTDKLQVGEKGKEVKKLQELLSKEGFYEGAIDGIYGKQTWDAVEKYRKKLEETKKTEEETNKSTTSLSRVIERLQKIAKGVGSVFSIAFKVFKFGIGIVKRLLKPLTPLLEVFLGIGEAVSNVLIGINDILEQSQLFEHILAGMDKLFSGGIFENAAKSVKGFFETFNKGLKYLRGGYGDESESLVNQGLIPQWAIDFKAKIDGIKEKISNLKIEETFEGLKEKFNKVFAIISWILNPEEKLPEMSGGGDVVLLNSEGTGESGSVPQWAVSFKQVIDTIRGWFEGIGSDIATVFNNLKAKFEEGFGVLSYIFTGDQANMPEDTKLPPWAIKIRGKINQIKNFFQRINVQLMFENFKKKFEEGFGVLSYIFTGDQANMPEDTKLPPWAIKIRGKINQIKNFFQRINIKLTFENLKKKFEDGWSIIASIFTGNESGIPEGTTLPTWVTVIRDKVTQIKNFFRRINIQSVFENLKNKFVEGWGIIVSIFTGNESGIPEGTTLPTWVALIRSKITQIKKFFQRINIKLTFENLKKKFEEAWDIVVKIFNGDESGLQDLQLPSWVISIGRRIYKIKTLIQSIDIKEVFENLKAKFEEVWDTIKYIFDGNSEKLPSEGEDGKYPSWVEWLRELVNTIDTEFSNLGITNPLSTLFDSFKKGIEYLQNPEVFEGDESIPAWAKILHNAIEAAKSLIEGDFQGFGNRLGEILDGIIKIIQDKITTAIEAIKGLFSGEFSLTDLINNLFFGGGGKSTENSENKSDKTKRFENKNKEALLSDKKSPYDLSGDLGYGEFDLFSWLIPGGLAEGKLDSKSVDKSGKEATGFLTSITDNLGSLGEGIMKVIPGLAGVGVGYFGLKSMLGKNKKKSVIESVSDLIGNIGSSIALMAGSLVAIAGAREAGLDIDKAFDDIKNLLIAIGVFIVSVVGILKGEDAAADWFQVKKLGSGKDTTSDMQKEIEAIGKVLEGLAGSLFVMGLIIAGFGVLDPNIFKAGFSRLVLMLLTLATFLGISGLDFSVVSSSLDSTVIKDMSDLDSKMEESKEKTSKIGKSVKNLAGVFEGLGMTLLGMAASIAILGVLPKTTFRNGIKRIGLVLSELALFVGSIAGAEWLTNFGNKTDKERDFKGALDGVAKLIESLGESLSTILLLVASLDIVNGGEGSENLDKLNSLLQTLTLFMGVIEAAATLNSIFGKAGAGIDNLNATKELLKSTGLVLGIAAIVDFVLGAIQEFTSLDLKALSGSGSEIIHDVWNALMPIEGDIKSLFTLLGVIATIGIFDQFAPGMMTKGALDAGLALAALTGIITAMTDLLGWWAENPGMAERLKKGGEVLADIGNAIGGFIGGIAGSFIEQKGEGEASRLTKLGEALQSFGEGLGEVKDQPGLEGEVTRVLGIVGQVNTFFDGLFKTTDGEEFVKDNDQVYIDKLKNYQLTDGLLEAIGLFGKSMVSFGTALDKFSGKDTETISEDTTNVTETARSVAEFLSTLVNDPNVKNIEVNSSAFLSFFGGSGKTVDVLTALKTFGDALISLHGGVTSFSESGFSDKFDAVKGSLEKLSEFVGDLTNNDAYSILWNGSGILSDPKILAFNDFVGNLAEVLNSLGTTINTQWNEGSATAVLTSFSSLISTLSGTGENALTADSILANLDAEAIGKKVIDFVNVLAPKITEAAGSLSSAADDFNTAGSGVSTGFADSIDSNAGDANASSLGKNAASALSNSAGDTTKVGRNFGIGFANGINKMLPVIRKAGSNAGEAAYNALKNAIKQGSPSKLTAKSGKFFDLGFANGISKYSKIASKSASNLGISAIDAMQGSLVSFGDILQNGLDGDPTIRPVVDMTNVRNSAAEINGMFGGRNLSLGSSINGVQSAYNSRQSRQDRASGNSYQTSNANNSVNFTGSTFYVRNESDINRLANEIASLRNRQQRSLGANIAG